MPLNSLKDSYIALVPRGFHHVFAERLKREIQRGGFSCSDLTFVGEQSDPEQYRQHLTKLLSNRKKQHSEKIGTVRDTFRNEDVSVGYNGCGETVWCIPGTACCVWVYFATNAPADFCHDHLRFIGPLMACVQTWENIDLDQGMSLDQATTLLKQLDLEPTKLQAALKLWLSHVEQSWPLSEEELTVLKAKMTSDNDSSVLSYRLSCVREKSKKYSYTREQFIKAAADYVIPKDYGWKVDLVNYNVEVVLLVQSNSLAVGLALRPYRQLQAKGFSQGVIPPDVTTPYLSGNTLSGLVRLRPTTAQLLLGMLDLNPGDVVLDPCAGIGTIPLEVPNGVIALGGDLILSDSACRPVAADYFKRIKQHNISCKADLLAWDAAVLPLRTSSVDAVLVGFAIRSTMLIKCKVG